MNSTDQIRILHFVPSMRAAGIENFIMNLYRHIDRTKIQFDFVVHTKKPQIYDEEIRELGGRIYQLTYKDDKNLFKYIKDLHKLFNSHPEYKIIHGNMQSMMPLYLYIAKKHNVPIRIAHAHNSNHEKSLKGFLLHLFGKFTKYQSTINFACSNESGKYLFGSKDFIFIPNAIDIKRFKFNEKNRENIRNLLNIADDEILIGHIGRFEKQKNHKRLLAIFKEVHDKNPKTKLCLIGEGKLKRQIEYLANQLKLKDSIIFLGVQRNTQDYYSAMDVFVLPSLYEGLPVVSIEAQAEGLPCVIANNCTQQMNITNQIVFIDLSETNETWSNIILHEAKKAKTSRLQSYTKMQISQFNITSSVQQIAKVYLSLYKDEAL